METVLIFSLFTSEQREPDGVERLSNSEESDVGQNGKLEVQRPSGIHRQSPVKSEYFSPAVVAHAFNPSSWEAKAGRSL